MIEREEGTSSGGMNVYFLDFDTCTKQVLNFFDFTTLKWLNFRMRILIVDEGDTCMKRKLNLEHNLMIGLSGYAHA